MRKLRFSGNTAMVSEEENVSTDLPVERRIRSSIPDEILDMIDRYRVVKSALTEKEKLFKEETKDLQSEEAELKRELLQYGEQNQLESVTTETTVLQYTSRVQRTIDPARFLRFLQSIGKTKAFYDYCNVPITHAIQNFGEAVLTSSEVLQSTVNSYAGLKIRLK